MKPSQNNISGNQLFIEGIINAWQTHNKINPICSKGYLISHESHHHDSILLALKQNGMRLPEKTSLQELWMTWMWGE